MRKTQTPPNEKRFLALGAEVGASTSDMNLAWEYAQDAGLDLEGLSWYEKMEALYDRATVSLQCMADEGTLEA